MQKIGIYVTLLICFFSLPVMAQEAGWINHFDGQPENYSVQRGEETVPVAFLTVLNVGDHISVSDKQYTIELNLQGGNQSVTVTHENSPFLIEANNQVPAELEQQWTWLKQRFSEWHKLTQVAKATDDEAASSALTIPLLENLKQAATLVAGKRPLHLQWYGGKAPYQVQIKKRYDELLSLTSEETQVKTQVLDFEAGQSYRVIITDANDKVFIGGFKAVASDQVPSSPTVSPANDLSEEIRQTLQATWLVEQAEGKWIFEAYQQIASIKYLPAQLLRQALAKGQEKQNTRGIRG